MFLIVEGNISAGKSTFLKLLQTYLPVEVVYEPLEQWQRVGGSSENLLEKFYHDTSRWAYTFQSYAFITRILAQEASAKKSSAPVHVLERSVFSDRYCFAQNCYETGLMTALEWKLYQEWFTWLVETYMTLPHAFLYLQANPTTCYERLLKRNRQEETVVPFDYIKRLHEKHEDWLIKKEDVAPYLKNTPVLVLPCNNDFESNQEEQHEHIHKITSFLKDNFNLFMETKRRSSLSL